ncbi:MAG TPA: nucleotide exchange factor GrpE [Verrucomicrobiae bacterium]|jgi:molecular chaperone GrpE
MSNEKKTTAPSVPADETPVASESAQTTAVAGPVAVTLPAEELEELKAQAAKADEHWQRVLRTAAEFDNFKKRAARERDDAIKFASQSLLGRLVPVLDNFEMALAAATSAPGGGNAESLKTGVNMILGQFKSVLTEAGLEEIDATGQAFNPTLHEAVSEQETADVPEGQVVQQLRKGYKLRERLLRPASVVVAKKPAK